MRDIPFKFEIPVEFFEKAGAPKGKGRRVGGPVSLQTEDQEGETLLQNGLDFSPFLKSGWLNDNHSPKTAEGLLGYPDSTEVFQKGETLPNGKPASSKLTWVEGYLLDDWEPADKIWKLGKALQGTGRTLGFSVEGKIHRRTGPKTVFKKARKGDGGKWVGNTVARATVRDVAITRCPVHDDAQMEILAKGLAAVEDFDEEDLELRVVKLEKALTMGDAPSDGALPEGPVTGEGAGRLLAPESVEGAKTDTRKKECTCGKKPCICHGMKVTTYKSLSRDQARWWVADKLPQLDDGGIDRFLKIITALKNQGRL